MRRYKVIKIQYSFTLEAHFTTNKYYTNKNKLFKKTNIKYINISPTTIKHTKNTK